MDIKTERHECDLVRIKDYTGIYVAAYDKTECKYRFCSGNSIFVFDNFEEYEVEGSCCDNKLKDFYGKEGDDWDGKLPADTGSNHVITWLSDGSTMIFKSVGEACEFFAIRLRDTIRG